MIGPVLLTADAELRTRLATATASAILDAALDGPYAYLNPPPPKAERLRRRLLTLLEMVAEDREPPRDLRELARAEDPELFDCARRFHEENARRS